MLTYCTSIATHADSWYTGDGAKLDSELKGWLNAVKPAAQDNYHPPIAKCKAVIAPSASMSA